MDCPFLLCKQCRAGHQRIAATANHEVLALCALRTGVADLQRKRKVEPLCQNHQGEKKRFFCETCKELICRDCTVVEHRAHQFTTIDDAAPRLRQTMKELTQKLKHHVLLFQKSEADIRKMDSELIQYVSLAEQNVKERASAEEIKIEESLRTIHEGISSRSNYRSQILQGQGVTLTQSRSACTPPIPKNMSPTAAQDMFSSIDGNLGVLDDNIKKLIQSDQTVRTLIQRFTNTIEQEARDGKSKVKARRKQLLSKIHIISTEKQKFLNKSNKVVSTRIESIRHALKIANDLVTTASDADFLSLQSIIDGDVRSLLGQGPPEIHSGYQKIAFLKSSNTELGEVVVGPTWTSEIEIKPCYTTRRDNLNSYWRFDERERRQEAAHCITSIAAYGKDEILVGCEEAVVAYNTSGKRLVEHGITWDRPVTMNYVASLPTGVFVAAQASGRTLRIHLFNTQSSKPAKLRNISLQPWQRIITASGFGKDKLVIGCKGNNREVMVLDWSNGSVIRRQP